MQSLNMFQMIFGAAYVALALFGSFGRFQSTLFWRGLGIFALAGGLGHIIFGFSSWSTVTFGVCFIVLGFLHLRSSDRGAGKIVRA